MSERDPYERMMLLVVSSLYALFVGASYVLVILVGYWLWRLM